MLNHTPKNVIFLWLLLACLASSCGEREPQKGKPVTINASTATLPNHVKYTFHKRNEKGRKANEGDLLTFHLVVQNNEDAVLSTTYGKYKEPIKELPYEDNYFIHKPFFKEIFAMQQKEIV